MMKSAARESRRVTRKTGPGPNSAPKTARIRLIHWDAEEARRRAELLSAEGYVVDPTLPSGPSFFTALRKSPPDAVVIDLGRLPSQGRDIAVTIRHSPSTRRVPLVFIKGDPAKTEKVRKLLPDAAFTTWNAVRACLKSVISSPPLRPIATRSAFEAYAGVPLVKKLGIVEKAAVGLIGAPHAFRQTLGDLPEGASLSVLSRDDLPQTAKKRRLAVWFPRSLSELRRGLGAMEAACVTLCIAWPKKASGVRTDLTQQTVRKAGLEAGWVDYKIVSIDSTWSALLFARRKPSAK
jgi:CheY-like chemotaxis protein